MTLQEFIRNVRSIGFSATVPSSSHEGGFVIENGEWTYGIIAKDGMFHPVDGGAEIRVGWDNMSVALSANSTEQKSHKLRITVNSSEGEKVHIIKGKKGVHDSDNGWADDSTPNKPYPPNSVALLESIRKDYPFITDLMSYNRLGGVMCINAHELITRAPMTLITDKDAYRHKYSAGAVPMDDTLDNLVKQYVAYLHARDGCNSPPSGIRMTDVDAVLDILAQCNTVHPFLDKVESIPWDGKFRLRTHYKDCLGAFCHNLTEEESTEYLAQLAINWFVGVIARQFGECKMEILPVIYGDQGIGKTDYTHAMALGAEYVAEISGSINPNEGVRELVQTFRGAIIVDVVEGKWLLDTPSQQVKGMISATKDKTRMAYAHYEKEFRRTFGFFCSTNEKGFCKDPTGDRRIYPFEATGAGTVDFRHDAYYCQQCWAEALWYFREAYEPELRKTSNWQIVMPERMEKVLGPKARVPYRALDVNEDQVGQALDRFFPDVGTIISYTDAINALRASEWVGDSKDIKSAIRKYMNTTRSWVQTSEGKHKAFGQSHFTQAGNMIGFVEANNESKVARFIRADVVAPPRIQFDRPVYTVGAYDNLPYRIWLKKYASKVAGVTGSTVKPRVDPDGDFSVNNLPMVNCLMKILTEKGILEIKTELKSITIYRTAIGTDSDSWEDCIPTEGDSDRKMTAIKEFYALVRERNITVGDRVGDGMDGYAQYGLTEDGYALFGCDTPDMDWDVLLPEGRSHNELSSAMEGKIIPRLPCKTAGISEFF